MTNGVINTYHAVIGKDLDIIHWTAQVLGYLPSDTSYGFIAVGLQHTENEKRYSTGDVSAHNKGLLQDARKLPLYLQGEGVFGWLISDMKSDRMSIERGSVR